MPPTEIPQLALLDQPSPGDLIIVYDQNNSDARRFSLSALAAYFTSTLSAGAMMSVYAAPSASPFTVTLPNVSNNIWLLLTPTGTMAVGTIVLPPLPVDHQLVDVVCTQAVTSLTITPGSGMTVSGQPTTLAANAFFRLRYEAVVKNWYQVA